MTTLLTTPMTQWGIFTTGTDTNVGKTYVGRSIIKALMEQGVRVRPRKPVESGWQQDELKTDAGLLAQAAGKSELIQHVCPNPLIAAVSPVRAATLEGKELLVSALKKQCLDNIQRDDFLYVEGAGGFYSPLASDGLNADLAGQLALPLLLVAEDKLGCINQILLTLEAIERRGLEVKAIVLNQLGRTGYTGSTKNTEMNNAEDLLGYTSVPVFIYCYEQEEIPVGLLDAIFMGNQEIEE